GRRTDPAPGHGRRRGHLRQRVRGRRGALPGQRSQVPRALRRNGAGRGSTALRGDRTTGAPIPLVIVTAPNVALSLPRGGYQKLSGSRQEIFGELANTSAIRPRSKQRFP